MFQLTFLDVLKYLCCIRNHLPHRQGLENFFNAWELELLCAVQRMEVQNRAFWHKILGRISTRKARQSRGPEQSFHRRFSFPLFVRTGTQPLGTELPEASARGAGQPIR